MQLAPLGTRGTAASNAAADATSTSAEAAASSAAREAGPLRGGLRSQGSQINQQVASAQQALNYLQQLASQLQSLKIELGNRLAEQRSAPVAAESPASAAATAAATTTANASPSPGSVAAAPQPSALQQQLRELDATWRERSSRAGGQLNSQLRYSESAPAQQRFKVRGLSLAAMQSSERETLNLAVTAASGSSQTVTVAVEPQLSRQSLVRRFDQALAPTGIRAAMDAGGELQFSVAEPLWSDVQDTLAIKGSGVIFPTGQMHRVKTEAEAPALRPAAWRTDNVSNLRQSLQEVMVALDRIHQAQNEVSQALARSVRQLTQTGTGSSTGTDAAGDSAWAKAFTEQFGQLADQPSYQSVATVAPALLGISRHRVLAMLATG